MLYKLLIFAMLTLSLSLASAGSTDWKLDKSHTHIGFMVAWESREFVGVLPNLRPASRR